MRAVRTALTRPECRAHSAVGLKVHSETGSADLFFNLLNSCPWFNPGQLHIFIPKICPSQKRAVRALRGVRGCRGCYPTDPYPSSTLCHMDHP